MQDIQPIFSFGIKTLWSPTDDIPTEIIKEVGNAKTSILMMIYGFTLVPLTDLLIAKHQAGLQVQCVMDKTQASLPTEKIQVQRLIDAGIDVVIGTSPVAGQIMHEKGLCIDGERTITGSFNFSTSAEKQVNHADFIYSIDRANKFTEFFNLIRADMLAKEAK